MLRPARSTVSLIVLVLAAASASACTDFAKEGPVAAGGAAAGFAPFGGESGTAGVGAGGAASGGGAQQNGGGAANGGAAGKPGAQSVAGQGGAGVGGPAGKGGAQSTGGQGGSVGGAVNGGAAGVSGAQSAGGYGGNGGGSSGGAGGAAGSCTTVTDAGYSVGFYPENKASSEQEIHPFFQITNATGGFVSLTRIKLRYYFTKEPAGNETPTCFWVTGDLCSAASFRFQDFSPRTATANRFMEVSFTGTTVSLDASPFEVRTGFTVGEVTMNQSNDYSFDPSSETLVTPGVFPYRAWTHVTMYVDGLLVWGEEPCAG